MASGKRKQWTDLTRNDNPSLLSKDALASWPESEIAAYIDHQKGEADRHWSIDPKKSLKYADNIQKVGYATDNLSYIALGMMAQGDALKHLGQIQEAWDILDIAGNLYLSDNNEIGWARTRIGRVFISIEVDSIDSALADATRAREILIQHNRIDKCVFLDMNVATIYDRLGNTVQALHHYDRALAMALSLGEDGMRLLWPIHYNMALTYVETGNLGQAEANYDQSIALAVDQGQMRNAVMAMTSRADLAQIQGKYREALTLLHQAIDLAGNKLFVEILYTRRIVAECYLHLNRNQDARTLASKVIDGFIEQSLHYEAARSLFQLGLAEANLGNLDAAMRAFDEAEKRFGTSNKSVWFSKFQLQRGKIALRQEDMTAALRMARHSMTMSDPDCPTFAWATLLTSETYLAQRQLEEAEQAVYQALVVAQRSGLLPIRYAAHLLLGKIAEANNRRARAIRYYRAAAAAIERSQRHLTISLRPGFLEDKGEALRSLIRLQLSAGKTEEAFMTLERAKSQVLLGYLANRESLQWRHTDEATGTLLKQLNELRREHHWYYNLVYHETTETQEPSSALTIQEAVNELKIREKRMREITERLYLLNEDATKHRIVREALLKDIQNNLSDDDLLIEYYIDGTHVWAFTVDRHNVQVHALEEPASFVSGLITKLQANLDWALGLEPDDPLCHKLTDLYQQIAGHLHRVLLPFSEGLFEGKTRLTIVPYGALHYLPFSTLFDGEHYLVDSYDVVILPASGLLTQKPPERAKGARALAHSWEGKLPNTLQEARHVVEVLGGELYSEQQARQEVLAGPPLQVLHIAVHGEHRLEVPELSFIQLEDGQAYVDDFLQEDLSYELVTLSGCETGRANVTSGEELIGLGRGFLYAGAGAILASLWRVDDEVTRELMQHFYGHLSRGASKSCALRMAQRALLTEYPKLHPTYWGALQLIGNPNPLTDGM